MCFPKPPQDNSAGLARQQEEERKARIQQGQAAIEKEFAAFNPDYFNRYQQSYLDNYNPQVDEQFGNARKDLRYSLARAHTLDSSGANTAFGKLTGAYDDQRRAITSNAVDATNKIRQQVEQNRGDLLAQNTAAADPSLAAINAVGRAGSLQTTPTYSPLGDLFSGFTNAGASYLAGKGGALPYGYSTAFKPGGTLPSGYSSGSGSVIG
jgi:hypothetical protein